MPTFSPSFFQFSVTPSESVECQMRPAAAMPADQSLALATRLALTCRGGRPLLVRRSLILATNAASSPVVSAWADAGGYSADTAKARISP
jgi:hypothetical protein